MMSMNVSAFALALSLMSSASAQVLQTYTANQQTHNQRALGYPVPVPIDSLTPIDGFRSYASLHARLQSLALESPDLAAHRVGSTFNGQPVWAYVVSSADAINAEGRAKPAFFINSTTHAREWGAPEVAVGLVERLTNSPSNDGLVRYLLDNTRLVIVPVQNVDGFRQTQRFPAQVIVGQDPQVPGDWPRDGRMRRKNMRAVDEILTTFADHLGGIDLNRNHPPFWGTTTNGGQLSNPLDLTFRGAAAQSEPEVAALLAAADLGPISRMRLGIDLHSFSSVFFSSNTGRARLNTTQTRLLRSVSQHHAAVPTAAGVANGRVYVDVPDPANRGVGVASEYFAYQWLVPALTLELEPGNGGGSEYGGSADSHSGFAMPESQVRRVREAWAESFMTAFYFMAGAPHLRKLSLKSAATGVLLQSKEWVAAPGAESRTLTTVTGDPLGAGQPLLARLEFSKPMRRLVAGQSEGLPGISVEQLPQVWLTQGASRARLDIRDGHWVESSDYRGTATAFEFVFHAPIEAGEFHLEVAVADMVGLELDANPASPVEWSAGAWTGWNATTSSASEGDMGGTDRSMRLQTINLQMPRIVETPPSVVGEGDIVRLRVSLDTPAERRIQIHAEDPRVTFFRPTVSPPPPAVPIVRWEAGETGPRELWLKVPDDARANGEWGWEALAGITTSEGVFEFARISFRVLDNDAPGAAVIALPFLDYGVAGSGQQSSIHSALNLGLNSEGGFEVVLHADRHYPARIGTDQLVTTPVVGFVSIYGNGASIQLPSQTDVAPVFSVNVGASLFLDGVVFETTAALPQAGVSATQPTLVNSAGVTYISRVAAAGLDGSGSLFGGTGEVLLQQSSIRGTQTLSSLNSTGDLLVRSSSLIQNVGTNPIIVSAGSGEVAWNSLLFNVSTANRFDTTDASSSLRLTGNIIQNNSSPTSLDPPSSDCGPGVSSGGFNLYSGASCSMLTAEGDRIGLTLGYIAPTAEPPAWLEPRGLAIDYGGDCGGIDQRGAPRPQTLDPNAEPRCDVGAIELGINPYRGIWQPARAGHGVDLQTSGNRLLLAWYTYDDDGQPTAYQAVAPLTGPRWRAELTRSSRNPQTGAINVPSRVGHVGIDFIDDTHASLSWRFDNRGVNGSEAITAFRFAPGEPRVEVTGLWFPPADSGYGATITRRGEVTALGLYYYDAAGSLRWALGTGGAESVDDVAMLSYTGFCPDCDAAAMPVQSQPAGRVLFHFLTPRRARIDTDVTYPGSNGGRWQRSSAAFVPLNDPVDNREAVANGLD